MKEAEDNYEDKKVKEGGRVEENEGGKMKEGGTIKEGKR